MTDIGAADYGFIHPQIIPEPDSPLTVRWGSAIAKGVARITSAGYGTGTTSTATVFQTIPIGNPDFNGVPLLKLYTSADGVTFTDYTVLGTGCSTENSPLSADSLGFQIFDGPTDKVFVEWGTRNGGAPGVRLDAYIYGVYGR